jgi:hypothetical protein
MLFYNILQRVKFLRGFYRGSWELEVTTPPSSVKPEKWPIGQRIICPRCGREGKAGVSTFRAKGREYTYLVVNHSDARKCIIARAGEEVLQHIKQPRKRTARQGEVGEQRVRAIIMRPTPQLKALFEELVSMAMEIRGYAEAEKKITENEACESSNEAYFILVLPQSFLKTLDEKLKEKHARKAEEKAVEVIK